MNKILIIVISLIFSLSFMTTFSTALFEGEANVIYKLSNNIYYDTNYSNLNETIIAYKSNIDLSKSKIKSNCNIESKIIKQNNGIYLFNLKFLNKNCTNNEFYLENNNGLIIYNSNFKLNLISDFKLLSILLDYSSKDLENFQKTLEINNKNLDIYKNFSGSLENDKYGFLKKRRILEELKYKTKIVNDILEKRKNKYLIPVPGYKLPTKNLSKIPNSGRPYRTDITDGIHHSWDIDAPFGQKVISLDDGIIIRILKNWDTTDFSNLRKGKNLTKEDKTRNLDILRGNQIWIKTMKGDLVMYSHLDKIVDSLNEGTLIKKGEYVGNIGTSGVPEEGYKDFHLDFSISPNPYSIGKAGTYTIVDYMNWNWKFIGKSSQYIIEHQNELFE